jgi:hypothetical protein
VLVEEVPPVPELELVSLEGEVQQCLGFHSLALHDLWVHAPVVKLLVKRSRTPYMAGSQ